MTKRPSPHPTPENLPDLLREWRKREGISQRAAAQRLGVSRFSAESWEAGRRFPGGRMLLKIIREIGLTPFNC